MREQVGVPTHEGDGELQLRQRGRDLDTARRQMFAREGKSPEFDLVSKSFANLMRMWAED